MAEIISADAVKVASALIDQINSSGGGMLTEEQKRTFKALRAIADPEEKSAKTVEIMTQLIADARTTLENGQDVQQQAESLSGQFSPEAQQEIRNGVNAFEGQLRSEAQAELRSLTATNKSSAARRARVRI